MLWKWQLFPVLGLAKWNILLEQKHYGGLDEDIYPHASNGLIIRPNMNLMMVSKLTKRRCIDQSIMRRQGRKFDKFQNYTIQLIAWSSYSEVNCQNNIIPLILFEQDSQTIFDWRQLDMHNQKGSFNTNNIYTNKR